MATIITDERVLTRRGRPSTYPEDWFDGQLRHITLDELHGDPKRAWTALRTRAWRKGLRTNGTVAPDGGLFFRTYTP